MVALEKIKGKKYYYNLFYYFLHWLDDSEA